MDSALEPWHLTARRCSFRNFHLMVDILHTSASSQEFRISLYARWMVVSWVGRTSTRQLRHQRYRQAASLPTAQQTLKTDRWRYLYRIWTGRTASSSHIRRKQ